MLKLIFDLAHYVDWSGRRETPAGKAGQGRPRRRVMRRGGSLTARGKRVPGAEINRQV
ncbi:hypothetical protein [Neobacillus ginsengisoli]|uniref:Uncharacterized protein n=1 Tax=Neobacillus ginsengisoli TaxID=904295 RepID=A0ABT9Y178_9BACI|nr:hypothetical protein [Neobacillus ginsengisoli]MDQ0200907.1 hypothetical protein [Neobacillus ginsengisoli]